MRRVAGFGGCGVAAGLAVWLAGGCAGLGVEARFAVSRGGEGKGGWGVEGGRGGGGGWGCWLGVAGCWIGSGRAGALCLEVSNCRVFDYANLWGPRPGTRLSASAPRRPPAARAAGATGAPVANAGPPRGWPRGSTVLGHAVWFLGFGCCSSCCGCFWRFCGSGRSTKRERPRRSATSGKFNVKANVLCTAPAPKTVKAEAAERLYGLSGAAVEAASFGSVTLGDSSRPRNIGPRRLLRHGWAGGRGG